MASLTITGSISESGDPGRPNEDAWGCTSDCAFVIDGATGLGPQLLAEADSDAAWLARLARDRLEDLLEPDRSMAEIVRATNEHARIELTRVIGELGAVPSWQLPVAGFQLIRLVDATVEIHGLGDCRLFLRGADGEVVVASAMDSRAEENEGARRALALLGGLGKTDPVSHAEVADVLRRRRATYNRPGTDVWTLGVEPSAADHLVSLYPQITLPARGVLCTDGFGALVDTYAIYSPTDFIDAAVDQGLPSLMRQLRKVEHKDDPEGALFPRFKRSDDATAMSFEIA